MMCGISIGGIIGCVFDSFSCVIVGMGVCSWFGVIFCGSVVIVCFVVFCSSVIGIVGVFFIVVMGFIENGWLVVKYFVDGYVE